VLGAWDGADGVGHPVRLPGGGAEQSCGRSPLCRTRPGESARRGSSAPARRASRSTRVAPVQSSSPRVVVLT
jgi:hypothetical protein